MEYLFTFISRKTLAVATVWFLWSVRGTVLTVCTDLRLWKRACACVCECAARARVRVPVCEPVCAYEPVCVFLSVCNKCRYRHPYRKKNLQFGTRDSANE